MKTFLLLRNNKESGPYTADELIRAGLKAYDLVWVEGMSTAWRYPSEVEELKTFAPAVEEQPFDRFYKKPATQKADPVIEQPPVKKEKPRFRIAAAWNKIDANAAPASPQPVKTEAASSAASTTPGWKEVYSDWKSEVPEVKSTPTPAPARKEPAQLETKYSRSLDEIKERYVETVLKPKAKSSMNISVNAKQVGEVAMIVLVLAFGLWMVFKPDDKAVAKDKVAVTAQNEQAKEQAKPAASDEENTEEELPAENTPQIVAQQEEKPLVNRDANSVTEKTNPVYVTVDKKSSPANKTPNNKQSGNLPVRYASANTGSKQQKPGNISTQPVSGVRNAVKRNDGTVASAPKNDIIQTNTDAQKQAVANTTVPAVIKTPPVRKTVDELVRVEQMSKYAGVVQDVKLNVQNMTGAALDLVVVDLKYYDKKGFYKKGETLYIKNLPANRDVIIKAPDDLAASNVTYKVGLVSSAQNGISAVAD